MDKEEERARGVGKHGMSLNRFVEITGVVLVLESGWGRYAPR